MSHPPSAARYEPWIAVGLPVLLFASTVGQVGIWDPHELNVADLGRRAAVHVLGASWLELPGAENRIPTLGDVGRNELPVMSIALAFRLLGLGAAAGRLPMVLWGALGVGVLWLWLRRMASARAATYGALALATTPLYFVHARTMLGDVATMASLLAAFAGLSVALLDPSPRRGWAWGALGLGGLVAGYFCRGALISVAAPALAVVAAWAVAVDDRRRWPLALALTGTGLLALGAGLVALDRAAPMHFYRDLGSAVLGGQKFPTFDAVAQQLGHAMFPWSAFLPFALGRLLAEPAALDGDERARDRRLRSALFVGAGALYLAHGWVAPRVGVLPFAGVGLLAAAAGLALHDYERGAHPSRAFSVGTCALALLLAVDLSRMPEKAMSVFAIPHASFPESFAADGRRVVAAAAALFCALLLAAFLDGHEPVELDARKPWWRRYSAFDDVAAILRELNLVWQGNLSFVFVMLEAMLAGVAALLFLGERFQWRLAVGGALSADQRALLMRAWLLLPLGLLGGVFAALSARLWFRLLLRRAGAPRAWVAACAGVGAGLLMAFSYYPALAAQLSPQRVLETYRTQRGKGEPLGLLGVAGRSVAYYTGDEARPFAEPATAFQWLTAGPERRWLAARADDLPRLNSLYRALHREGGPGSTPDHNLPVLDARSSQIVLVSSALGPGERNQNPLAAFFSTTPPPSARPLRVNLENTLEALGWDVVDADDAVVTRVTPGKPYTLRLYFRVLAPSSAQWKVFVHIDGFGRRHNGDHDMLASKAPMSLWQPGDVVTDRYDFKLEPNFTPGNYNLYYGLFLGERRMVVLDGPHHENRIDGGTLAVR